MDKLQKIVKELYKKTKSSTFAEEYVKSVLGLKTGISPLKNCIKEPCVIKIDVPGQSYGHALYGVSHHSSATDIVARDQENSHVILHFNEEGIMQVDLLKIVPSELRSFEDVTAVKKGYDFWIKKEKVRITDVTSLQRTIDIIKQEQKMNKSSSMKIIPTKINSLPEISSKKQEQKNNSVNKVQRKTNNRISSLAPQKDSIIKSPSPRKEEKKDIIVARDTKKVSAFSSTHRMKKSQSKIEIQAKDKKVKEKNNNRQDFRQPIIHYHIFQLNNTLHNNRFEKPSKRYYLKKHN